MSLQVTPDHVYASMRTTPADSPAYVAQQLRGHTSRALREELSTLKRRLPTLWSPSFYVTTVGAVSAGTVQRYIDTQWERPWRKDSQLRPAEQASEALR
ncbi:hypothetical protein GCM10028789_26900 [Sinomonas halotolerans]